VHECTLQVEVVLVVEAAPGGRDDVVSFSGIGVSQFPESRTYIVPSRCSLAECRCGRARSRGQRRGFAGLAVGIVVVVFAFAGCLWVVRYSVQVRGVALPSGLSVRGRNWGTFLLFGPFSEWGQGCCWGVTGHRWEQNVFV